jgi:hypothetical protein
MSEEEKLTRIRDIIAQVRPLAAEYYRLTNKPLGVTGEIAEFVAAEMLNLKLVEARTQGHDAIAETPTGRVRVQIKGRVFGDKIKPGAKLSRINKTEENCDKVVLIILRKETLEVREIWEAPFAKVVEKLSRLGSNARGRGQLSIGEFRSVADKIPLPVGANS